MALKAELAVLWGSDDDDSDGKPTAAASKGDDGDVWGSDEAEDEPRHSESMAEREEKSARAKHYKEGYKDTVAYARESALQLGFGEGFTKGFAFGLRHGRLLGICTTAKDVCKESLEADSNLSGVIGDAKKESEQHNVAEGDMEMSILALERRARSALTPIAWADKLVQAT